MNKTFIVVIVLLLVILGVWFWAKPATAPEEPILSEEEIVREFVVEARDDFSFSLSSIEVEQGDVVRIMFTNTGDMPHDLVIENLGVATSILQNGQTEVLEFTAQESGEFEYYCSVGQHRENGMVGTLIVR